ncbi:MAG: ABC transporter ATP-binding protein [Acetobacteraceae bacterium]
MSKEDTVLEVRDLRTRFGPAEGGLVAVDGVSFALKRGRTTAIVGESGSGKSTVALSLLGLIDPPGRVVGGEVIFRGRNLVPLDERELRSVRGAHIGIIFQDPLTSLNPTLSIGTQIAETILAHEKLTQAGAMARVVGLLERVGVADAARRAADRPHQFSGGMRQRALIAAAIACRPEIIIADEPTTALDVTVQAKILRVLHDLQEEMTASLLLITHDLGVVAAMADDVVVMYAGRVVEQADVDSLFHAPSHPYTRALLACVTGLDDDRSAPFTPISGAPPHLRAPPPGCRFAPRCPEAEPACTAWEPRLRRVSPTQLAACLHVADAPVSV